jgi:NTP pyrophosphatase (non-canonical NTP hydrolase)
MSTNPMIATDRVLQEVLAERIRQDAKWGEQNGHDFEWVSILTEEVGEAAQAANEANFRSGKTRGDYTHLRAELVQVAAVAVAWIEAIDRRAAVVSDEAA